MDYRCPRCSLDLKNRLMPTAGAGRSIFRLPAFLGGAVRQRVPRCPGCETLLERNPHPLDTTLLRWGALPFILVLVGTLLDSRTVQVIAAALLVVGVTWAGWRITRPAYKQWKHWREFDGEA